MKILHALIAAIALPAACPAATWYVNNALGRDSFDGSAAIPSGSTNGPTRSISRALQFAHAGDTIDVANTGRPYYESFSLVGGRHSGFGSGYFTIDGNGAVVDGSREVPIGAWKLAGNQVWKLTPYRKGYYQLILNGKAVPEMTVPVGATRLPEIPVGEWAVWKGSIYLKASLLSDPREMGYRFAFRSVGLTLYHARSVWVKDLTFRWFRQDGVNAHDLSTGVVLEKVVVAENGRAGVAVAGTSAVTLKECETQKNRLHSVLVTELAGVQDDKSKLDKPVTLK